MLENFLKVSHNFWRWMSRLEQRWRTPLNAISVVNGRIPRIKRKLNAYCALRITLRACLVQDVYTIMPRNRSCIAWLLFMVFSCVSDELVARLASHWRIRLSSKRNGCVFLCPANLLWFYGRARRFVCWVATSKQFILCVWTQVGLPAEFKHISKRRTRKWTWFP